ncbi:hypothetical protein [uncultured Abyssibacter sp.]|uniref:hypothetical protein n=1 Tax=uncultured Abyssibacter sp. TaxID=2320202 RepID=UPI0032B256D4
MSVTEPLIVTIATNVSSVREGADAVVAHYAWRRSGGSDAGFAGQIAELHTQGLVDILPGNQTYLRLTPDGYQALPEPVDDDQEDEEADRHVRLDAAEMQALVNEIFNLAARAGEAGLTASALASIWRIERQRAADLRGVLDTMLNDGSLRVERGQRTVFFRG